MSKVAGVGRRSNSKTSRYSVRQSGFIRLLSDFYYWNDLGLGKALVPWQSYVLVLFSQKGAPTKRECSVGRIERHFF